MGLIYAPFIAFFVWLGNGLLAARLRSEAIRVTARQMPVLHANFKIVCERLGLREMPKLYVTQAGGALNAFAMRHAGRDFVVVYSELIESIGEDSAEMQFVLGHEIGHIKSRHLWKQILLAPGLICPLPGPAYRRSWKTSCDRYGAYACDDTQASMRAMLVLSGGKQARLGCEASEFALQHEEDRGFFVSLHELSSTYPTLSRRVADLQALPTGAVVPSPKRHPLAYLLALVVPPGGGSAPASLMVMVVVIGLMAAMAIPAFQKVRTASQGLACANNQRQISGAFDQHVMESGAIPARVEEFMGPGKLIEATPTCLAGGTYEFSLDADKNLMTPCSVHGTIAEITARRATGR